MEGSVFFAGGVLRFKSIGDLLHASYHHTFLNKCLHHLEWSLHFESVSAVSEYTSQSGNMFVTTQKGAVTLNFVVPERAAES